MLELQSRRVQVIGCTPYRTKHSSFNAAAGDGRDIWVASQRTDSAVRPRPEVELRVYDSHVSRATHVAIKAGWRRNSRHRALPRRTSSRKNLAVALDPVPPPLASERPFGLDPYCLQMGWDGSEYERPWRFISVPITETPGGWWRRQPRPAPPHHPSDGPWSFCPHRVLASG